MQSIITLYFANRICKRDWNHPKMGKLGWGIAIAFILLISVIATRNTIKPDGTFIGYLVAAVITCIAIALLVQSLKKPRPTPQTFQPSKIMDFLAFGSVALFLFLGTFVVSGEKIVTSQPINLLAAHIENYWLFICCAIYFIYRYTKKKDVTV